MALISTVELRRRTDLMQRIRRVIKAETHRRRVHGFKAWNMGKLLALATKARKYLKAEIKRVEEKLYADA